MYDLQAFDAFWYSHLQRGRDSTRIERNRLTSEPVTFSTSCKNKY